MGYPIFIMIKLLFRKEESERVKKNIDRDSDWI
jgi:hypothetical protein